MKPNIKRPLAAVLGAVFLFGSAAWVGLWSRPRSAGAASAAPDFRLAEPGGRVFSLADFKGKVLLLAFWATWCKTCEEETPALSRLYRRYRGRGLAVLAPSMDQGGRAAVLAYMAAHELAYPVAMADVRTAEAYGVTGLPVHVLIDAEGRVVKRTAGPVDVAELENDILKLLPKP